MEKINYLNEVEKEAVANFIQNKLLANAVKKVILAGVYYNGTLVPGENPDPLKNFALALVNDGSVDDKVLGEKLRAANRGVQLIEQAYMMFETLIPKPEEKKEKVKNPAS